MKSLGQSIQKLRTEKAEPVIAVAAALNMDPAVLSKIEQGGQKANRGQVVKLADYFNEDKNNLLLQWLCDADYEPEDVDVVQLQVAEEPATYSINNKKEILSSFEDFFARDGRIYEAWIFGSFARGEDTVESDIDLMVRFFENKTISLFDIADIAYRLEQQIKRKIDLVEKGYIQPFALETAQKDLIKIYG